MLKPNDVGCPSDGEGTQHRFSQPLCAIRAKYQRLRNLEATQLCFSQFWRLGDPEGLASGGGASLCGYFQTAFVVASKWRSVVLLHSTPPQEPGICVPQRWKNQMCPCQFDKGLIWA